MALRHKIIVLSSNEDLLIRLESSLENEGFSTCRDGTQDTAYEPNEAATPNKGKSNTLFVQAA